jgi:hypothetical protein
MKVDDHLVGDPHDAVAADIVVRDVRNGVVREVFHCAPQRADVVSGGVDEEVDVLCGTHRAVKHDREASDEKVADVFPVQRTAERGEVPELRRA